MQGTRVRNSASFFRRTQLASLMLLGCVSLVWAADKAAELSDDFLEYLGSLEGNDETWMDFAADAATHDSTPDSAKAKPQLAAKDSKTVVNASSSSAAGVTTKAASTSTGKADK